MEKSVRKWTLPPSYMGETWYDYYQSGFGRSRDSDTIEESNFQVASEQLLALCTDIHLGKPGPDNDGPSVLIVRESHWAVGWVEWIAIHETNKEAIALAEKLCERYNDYPLLSESHHSELEFNKAMEYWDSFSLSEKVHLCQDCNVSVFAARRSHDLPDRLWECLIS